MNRDLTLYKAQDFKIFIFVSCLLVLIGCKNNFGDYQYMKVFATPMDEILNRTGKSDSVLAVIEASGNFMNESSFFENDVDQKIRVIAYGEGADYKIFPTLIESYDNDGIEVYFDLNNDKFPYFNLNGDDRQYRILWNLLSIDGQNIKTQGIKVSQSDPTPNLYIIEMKFPWMTLGYVEPKPGRKIGFDVGILDNDGQTRESLCTWFSSDWESWNNTSFFGTLILKESEYSRSSTTAAEALKIDVPPRIDGKIDIIWENLKAYDCNKVITGKLDCKEDLNGYYKICWDNESLFLLVFVNDDIKSYAKVLFDYGWIEDTNGQIIWKMDMSKTKHAGGGLKNRYSDTIIDLPKGKYFLKYTTDESNSPSNWDVEPPKSNFYGIKLIKIAN